jgi:hypothetical protein
LIVSLPVSFCGLGKKIKGWTKGNPSCPHLVVIRTILGEYRAT